LSKCVAVACDIEGSVDNNIQALDDSSSFGLDSMPWAVETRCLIVLVSKIADQHCSREPYEVVERSSLGWA
jgi:hypothetical protein